MDNPINSGEIADMESAVTKYKKIYSNVFFEGMLMPADLYCKYKDNYVLVFKSELLTSKLILKIKQLELTYGNLYIENEFYDAVLAQSDMYRENLSNMNFNSSYSVLKEQTMNILEDVTLTNKINNVAADKVTDSIHEKILRIDEATIFQILNAVRTVDEYLYTHSSNVAVLNGLMGKWLGLPENEIHSLVRGGLLHDIGKTKIPREILDKPGTLTDEEFDIVKTHPIHSYNILINSGELDPIVLAAARNHHEKVNGKGYPDKLLYDDIPIHARITAISDVYDAMITKRVYKDAHSPFEILEDFAKGSYTDLDMDLVKVFVENMPKELIGKAVILSNGSIGEVVFVDETNLLHPLVRVGSEVFSTNDKINCVCMYQGN